MKDDIDISARWSQVGLAILPGLFILVSKMNLWQRLLGVGVDYWAFTEIVLLLLCISLCALGFFRSHRFPVWSLVPLGIVLQYVLMSASIWPASLVVGLGILGWAIAAWYLPSTLPEWREKALFALLVVGTLLFVLLSSIGTPPTRADPQMLTNVLQWPQFILFALSVFLFALSVFGLVPAIVGLSLARRVGVLAGLVVVGAGYVVWDQIGDPAYALLMYTDNRTLVTWVSMLPALFFLLVVPMAVLWFHSTKAWTVSYLLPICFAVTASIIAGYMIRPYKPSPLDLVLGFLWPVLPVVFAVVLYSRVAKDKPSVAFPA